MTKARKEYSNGSTLKWLLHTIALILLFNSVTAQNAKLKIDNSALRIGEQRSLNIELVAPPSHQLIDWPIKNDTLSDKIEIVKRSKVDTSLNKENGLKSYNQTLTITSFDSGYQTIKSLYFTIKAQGSDSLQTVQSDSLVLRIESMPVDTTKPIKAIKANMGAPITFSDILPWLLIALAVLFISALIFYYFWRRKHNKPLFVLPRKPKLPPYQVALEALQSTKEKHLWQQGKIKEYYTEITDIIRHYLDEQYSFGAAEMTTDEIIETFDQSQLNTAPRSNLVNLLTTADLVKFAKALPLPNENESSLADAVIFIEDTKPKVTDKGNNQMADISEETNMIKQPADAS